MKEAALDQAASFFLQYVIACLAYSQQPANKSTWMP